MITAKFLQFLFDFSTITMRGEGLWLDMEQIVAFCTDSALVTVGYWLWGFLFPISEVQSVRADFRVIASCPSWSRVWCRFRVSFLVSCSGGTPWVGGCPAGWLSSLHSGLASRWLLTFWIPPHKGQTVTVLNILCLWRAPEEKFTF